jgi:hypothetical protein
MESNDGINISKVNDFESFENKVKDYVSSHNPKLFILTPCYGGMCYINYLQCLINTLNVFKTYNFPIQVEFCKNDSLVSRARNNLIAKAMHDPACTHIIFIDNDITWNPLSILKLIIANKPIIGGAYPIKRYNWEKLTTNNKYDDTIIQKWIKKKNDNPFFNDTVSDINMIQSSLLRYNINYNDKYIEIKDNLTQVKHLATGFMLMQRQIIEKMMLAYHSTKYTDDINFLQGTENDYAYALFDCGVEDDHYLSEDWLFCNRWTKIGGSIWLDVTINLTHTGAEDYNGCLISSIL